MKVTVFNKQKDLPLSSPSVKKIVKHILKTEGISTNEVIIHFVDSSTISLLHAEFFNDPSITDCITFPVDGIEKAKEEKWHVLGELFICPKTAIDYLKLHPKVSCDPYLELTLYLVHGLLHLLGFDDIASSDRKKMREAELKMMKDLALNDLQICKTYIVD